jgi:hypothetical protein
MKALSLTQPWATLIAIGAKRIETRSWATPYRGILAIHAATAMPPDCREFAYADPAGKVLTDAGILLGGDCAALPRGAIVAVAHLVQVWPTRGFWDRNSVRDLPPATHEEDFGDYAEGRYGWLLTDVVPLSTPIPCKGALGVWEVPLDVEAQIREASRVGVR